MRKVLMAGLAAVALAGVGAAARAGTPETHVMTVQLPDGQVAEVRYIGAVAPTVMLVPPAPDWSVDPAFAMLARMTAAMDQEMAALLPAVQGLGVPDLVPASAGPGFCVRSVQVTYQGDGRAPLVVTQTAGDCGSAHEVAPAALPAAPGPDRPPAVIQARAGRPNQDLVHPVAWQR